MLPRELNPYYVSPSTLTLCVIELFSFAVSDENFMEAFLISVFKRLKLFYHVETSIVFKRQKCFDF